MKVFDTHKYSEKKNDITDLRSPQDIIHIDDLCNIIIKFHEQEYGYITSDDQPRCAYFIVGFVRAALENYRPGIKLIETT